MSLDPRIPYGQIRHLVGAEHVGAEDGAIRDMISQRAANNGWPEDATLIAQDFAVQVHHDNQELYSFVIRGAAA